MNCSLAREVVNRWEAGEIGGLEEYEALSTHLLECEGCRARYGVISGLMGRDLGVQGAIPIRKTEPEPGFTARVMEGLDRNRAPLRRLPARPVVLRFASLAAAALLVVALGIAFGSRSSGSSTNEMVVHFVLDAPGAERVALVGSFTDWNPEELSLKRQDGSSRWEISVPLKRGETYLYNFVIDGTTWIPDPTRQVQVSDGFGGESSLIQL